MFNSITVTDITDMYTVKSRVGQSVSIEKRKYYGISLCKSGKVTYTHNGKRYVSHQGNAVILPQNATYRLHNDIGGEFPVINFTCDPAFTEEFSVITLKHPADYVRDYERILKYLSAPDGRLKALALFYGMLYNLFSETRADNPILNKVLPYIENNIAAAELSNRKIADYVNISESYLRKLFSANMNISPKQYVLSRRIKRAERLLAETDLKINEISVECGFSNVYHFCRSFKETQGVTPTNYRLSHRKFDI